MVLRVDDHLRIGLLGSLLDRVEGGIHLADLGEQRLQFLAGIQQHKAFPDFGIAAGQHIEQLDIAAFNTGTHDITFSNPFALA